MPLCGSQQTEKFFKRWEYQTTWPASWEMCMQVRKQQLELDMEEQLELDMEKQIRKGIYPNHQGCIFSPCLFNLYEEYIMWNARLDQSHTGIKVASRYINNFRYADDTTESEEELKIPLVRVKVEKWNGWLKIKH